MLVLRDFNVHVFFVFPFSRWTMTSDYGDVVARIINLVRQYPALYDTTHEDYNRYYKKIQIWNSIAAEVNYSDGKLIG